MRASVVDRAVERGGELLLAVKVSRDHSRLKGEQSPSSRKVMSGLTPQLGSDKDMAKVRAHLTAGDGVGEPLITDFLKSIPGISKRTVAQQLAVLKSSGDYARIISEVTAEIEHENAVGDGGIERLVVQIAEVVERAPMHGQMFSMLNISQMIAFRDLDQHECRRAVSGDQDFIG